MGIYLQLKRMGLTALCFLAVNVPLFAADVLFIGNKDAQIDEFSKEKTISDFYGLSFELLRLTGTRADTSLIRDAVGTQALAIVLSVKGLPAVNRESLLAVIGQQKRSIPVLITGVTEQTDSALLSSWSAGAIRFCGRKKLAPSAVKYAVADDRPLTGPLGNETLPAPATNVLYLGVGDGQPALRWIIAAQDGTKRWPTFVRSSLGSQEVFFSVQTSVIPVPTSPDPYRQIGIFTNFAPQALFLRHAGGARSWHSPANYANLTIDDIWLKRQYGYVDYKALLAEMQLHNFHTTAAFVPWNFDRNQPETVALFRDNPSRFSICIHGNNHDHQEFGPYTEHPLAGQVENLKQALARMQRFSSLTQLPFDPVMVFPHSVSPESTFAAMKKYNYWATANSLSTPEGSAAPEDANFALRTETLHYGDFPSLRRYSEEAPGPRVQIAIDAFLGNPILFYVHHAFFAKGIGAFDETADWVNRIQPQIEWTGLGKIVQHLYLEKLRADGNYDIEMHSSVAQIENKSGHAAVYFIRKTEDFAFPLRLLIDGQDAPFEKGAQTLSTKITIPANQSRRIAVIYGNDFVPASADISKSSLSVFIIRYLSDFRDDIVAKSGVGRWFIVSYHEQPGLWLASVGALITLALFFLGLRWYRHVTLKKHLNVAMVATEAK
jgi:hypothetical protein